MFLLYIFRLYKINFSLIFESSIHKYLFDLKHEIRLEVSEFVLMNEIVEVLNPICLIVESLCRRDSILLIADAGKSYSLPNIW